MKNCCNGDCNQGRGCPQRIPTRRSAARRFLAIVWQAFEDNVWLPYLVVGVLLLIANFPT